MSIVALYLIILPFFICVPLLLGIYVYRDAKSRGMSALLWALIAALAPTFLGLIVYLLVRGNYSNLKCARCGGAVRETYTVCPQCGARLKAACANCGAPVEAGWKVCPQCAQPLGWEARDFTPPVKPVDRNLWKILLAVMVIPLLLLALLAVNFSAGNHAGAHHTAHYGEADFILLANQLDFDSAARTLRDQGKADDQHVYMMTSVKEAPGDMPQWNYLVYLPDAVASSVATGRESGLLGSHYRIQYETAQNERGEFIIMTIFSEREPDLVIQCGGKVKEYREIPVDFDLSQFTGIESFGTAEIEASAEYIAE